MSTFQGRMKEVPGISVDRFDGANLDSEAFFLSHCHTDHMVGLGHSLFHHELKENNRYIYTAHVSAEILKKTYPQLANNLIELDFHSATVIPLESKSITVTPIPAGHCPGSVMFLFEGDETVLYTGDYRIKPSDIPKFKAFYDSLNNQKRVDAVYLDTTFFLKEYAKFPSRSESLDEICKIIKEWISRSEQHVIDLKTFAKYGYEYLFIEVYKQVGMPVHVNDEIYEFYSRVPELDGAVTRDKKKTKIHSACGSTYTVICPNTITHKIKTVRVSAFRWRSENLQNGISETMQNHNVHCVCYSTHASYEEGAALLKFLKPRRVEANVLHDSAAVNAEIYRNIEENLTENEPKAKKVKLFSLAREEKKVRLFKFDDDEKEEHGVGEGEFDPLVSSILDSPPRNIIQ